jgi:hypothetical protein
MGSIAARLGDEDSAAGEFLAIATLAQEGFSTERPRSLDDRLLEGSVLESVEGVVMHEDADRPLSRQIVGRIRNDLREFVQLKGIACGHERLRPAGRAAARGGGGR